MSGLKARNWSSDGSSLTSTRGSSAGAAGKSSSIQSPSGWAPRTPLRVWNCSGPPLAAWPSCQRTWALARVAWPQRSISRVGENHRKFQSPSSRRTRNAVSDRFISRATACIQSSAGYASSTHTAAGLPAKGRSVKASTVTSCRPTSVGASHHGDEVVLVGGEGHAAVPPLQAAHADALLVESVFELAAALPRDAGEPRVRRLDGLLDSGGVDGAVALTLLGLFLQRLLHVVEHVGYPDG